MKRARSWRPLWLTALLIQAAICPGCATTVVLPPDPKPLLGAQLRGEGGACVDVRDGVTADGTPIVLFQCHGSPNQRWFIGRGHIAENFGSCLDVQGAAAADGAAVILVTCNGRPSQHGGSSTGKSLQSATNAWIARAVRQNLRLWCWPPATECRVNDG